MNGFPPFTQTPLLYETEEDEESNDQNRLERGEVSVGGDGDEPSGDETLFTAPLPPSSKRRKTVAATPAKTATGGQTGKQSGKQPTTRKRPAAPPVQHRDPSPDPEELFVRCIYLTHSEKLINLEVLGTFHLTKSIPERILQ